MERRKRSGQFGVGKKETFLERGRLTEFKMNFTRW